MSKLTKAQKQEREEAIKTLREWIKPGDTLHTTVTHVARSGMQRCIKVFRTYVEDGAAHIHEVSYLAARAMGYHVHERHGGLIVGGCGMDMGFHIVYSLGQTLFPEGMTGWVSSIRESQAKRENPNATGETSGGYCLKHSWL